MRHVLRMSGAVVALAVACGAEDGGDTVPDAGPSGSGGGASGGSTASEGAASGGAGAVGGSASGGAGTGGALGSGGAPASSGGATASRGETASGGAGGGVAGGVVRLVALGDTGEGNADQHAVAAQMDARCEAVGGCDAVLLLGDNFYDNGVTGVDDAQWLPKFEDVYDLPALHGVPFYAALGNHDYGLTSTGSAEAQIAYGALPVGMGPGTRYSDKWHMPDRWYDVRLGDVHVFAFDTQDGLGTQGADVSARVAASTATWKLVFAHHPRFTAGDHNKDNWLVNAFVQMYALQEAVYCGADLFLAGHDHNLEFIDRGRDPGCPDTHFVISGAGSKTRTSGGVVRAEDGPGEFQLFYDESVEGFAYLEFAGRALHFEFVDKEGTVLFSRDIEK